MALVGASAATGRPLRCAGVTLFEVTGCQVVAGWLYLEDVERDVVGIEQAGEDLPVADRGPRARAPLVP